MTTSYVCPDCGAKIEVPESLAIGQHISCGHCGCKLEVATVNPVILAGGWDDEDPHRQPATNAGRRK